VKQGETVADIVVTGVYTHWDSTTRFAFGGGITVTSVEVLGETSAKLSIKIDPMAWIGIYSLNAVTSGEVASISKAFVVQPGTPIILSSGPGSAPQQGDVKFTILGQVTNWQQDVTSIF
jgi:hypothetical protein